MVKTNRTMQEMKGVIQAGLLILFLLATCVEIKAAPESGENIRCDYSSFLQDPAEKARYLEMRQEMELIARIRTQNFARAPIGWPAEDTESSRTLDYTSRECMACHTAKGQSARDDIYSQGHPGMSAISATHAIGTDYVAARARRANLRDIADLPPGMTLVDGRISCITCHNPLNTKRFSLAVDSPGAPLCIACHVI